MLLASHSPRDVQPAVRTAARAKAEPHPRGHQARGRVFHGVRRQRSVIVVDLPMRPRSPSEPWFLTFNADVQFHPVMTPTIWPRRARRPGKKWA